MKMKKYNCPVCNKESSEKETTAHNFHGNKLISKSEEYDYYRCRNCYALFLVNVKFDDEFFNKNYDESYYEDTKGLKGSLEKIYTKYSLYKKRSLVEKVLYSSGFKAPYRIIDLGAGDGKFLKSFEDQNYKLHGVEKGRELDINDITMHNVDIFKFNSNKKFDLVTLWHVIEHIHDPNKLFKKMNSILKDKGYVALSTPNIDSWGYKKSGKHWFHLDAPRHNILYNTKAINYLAKKHNFKVIVALSDRFEYPLDLFWSVRDKPEKYLIYPFYPIFKLLSKETVCYVLRKS